MWGVKDETWERTNTENYAPEAGEIAVTADHGFAYSNQIAGNFKSETRGQNTALAPRIVAY